MSSALFHRTRGWLARDGFAMPAAVMVLVILVIGGWGAWFVLAEIPLYEVAKSARIEVAEAAHRIEAPVSGRVVASMVSMGATVKAGDLLIELDTSTERLEVEEQRAALVARQAQIEPMRREVIVAEQALASARESLPVLVAEARARTKATRATAAFNREQAARFREMEKAGVASDFERREAMARARESSEGSKASRLEAEKLELSEKTRLSEQEISLERLRRELAGLEGEIETTAARIKRLEFEIERRRIRAPIDGTIGEIQTLRVGDVVQEAEHLGTIVPAGTLILVAEFDPKVLGRIQPGQGARMSPTGFPSTQYGVLHAKVTHAASEIRNGLLRVEMALEPDEGSAIPLEHGLPGGVEVEVERVSPATLVLRGVGKVLHPEAEQPAVPAQHASPSGQPVPEPSK
jgi:membrane fusion protein (multidrug efflux system)